MIFLNAIQKRFEKYSIQKRIQNIKYKMVIFKFGIFYLVSKIMFKNVNKRKFSILFLKLKFCKIKNMT